MRWKSCWQAAACSITFFLLGFSLPAFYMILNPSGPSQCAQTRYFRKFTEAGTQEEIRLLGERAYNLDPILFAGRVSNSDALTEEHLLVATDLLSQGDVHPFLWAGTALRTCLTTSRSTRERIIDSLSLEARFHMLSLLEGNIHTHRDALDSLRGDFKDSLIYKISEKGGPVPVGSQNSSAN